MSVRVAQFLTRVLTWGMAAEERREYLIESVSDWESMRSDRSSARVVGRALRGLPVGIWMRLSDRRVTAIPAGVALALFGVGGLIAAAAGATYPATLRRFAALTGCGMILAAASLLRNPSRMAIPRFRAAATLIAVGAIGGATNLPGPEQWPHETPIPDTAVLDLTIQTSLMLIGIGCACLVVGSFVRNRRLLISFAGTLVVGGTALFACSQIIWGIWAARADVTITIASFVMGLASLSIVHVLPRVRHLHATW